ncbi:MAG: cytochrome c oxidase subunit 3 [Deltaproteobacteria bacterium]|nr:cytochrome c oxidase subunit 3 [Deltaproteobacteria bacterium]
MPEPQPNDLGAAAHAGRPSLLEPPGGILMWIIVALELLTFSIIFVFVASFRAADAEAFRAGQAFLDPRLGVAQTLALLTSGWLVAEAVHAYRRARIPRARGFYAGGIAASLVFVALKIVDYSSKAEAGLSLDSDFGAAYFLATGFHFAHVLVGVLMLTHAATRIGRKPFEDEELAVAGTALFWHMCDIAWFFLFPLLYAG